MIPAVGTLALPLQLLRGMLIASPAWIAWRGTVDAANPGEYLIRSPESLMRPHVIIDFDGNFSRSRDAIALRRFAQNTALQIYFCESPTPGAPDDDATIAFLDRIDAVMGQIEIMPPLAGGNSLSIDGYTIKSGPLRTPPDQVDRQGDIIELIISIDARMRA